MSKEQEQEHRWTMLQQALNAEANGYDVKPFVSQRTLFGIRPTAEVVLDEYVAKLEAERLAAKKAAQHAHAQESESANSAPADSGDAHGKHTMQDPLGGHAESATPEAAPHAAKAAARTTSDPKANNESEAFKRYGEWYTRK